MAPVSITTSKKTLQTSFTFFTVAVWLTRLHFSLLTLFRNLLLKRNQPPLPERLQPLLLEKLHLKLPRSLLPRLQPRLLEKERRSQRRPERKLTLPTSTVSSSKSTQTLVSPTRPWLSSTLSSKISSRELLLNLPNWLREYLLFIHSLDASISISHTSLTLSLILSLFTHTDTTRNLPSLLVRSKLPSDSFSQENCPSTLSLKEPSPSPSTLHPSKWFLTFLTGLLSISALFLLSLHDLVSFTFILSLLFVLCI